MMKTAGAGVLIAGALYFGGALDTDYSRVVARPPAEVANAIVDLDFNSAPGGPVSDPSASAGIRPRFQVERLEDRVVWTVKAGNEVATRMTALLEPVEGGAKTRVRVAIERGDAPDDHVAVAFRSEGLTKALFATVLEAELNKLVASGSGWSTRCQAIVDRVREQGEGNADDRVAEAVESGPSLGAAFGRTAKMGLQLNAVETELRSAGCDPDARRTNEMRNVQSRMAEMEGGKVSFEPGKPMIDLRPGQ